MAKSISTTSYSKYPVYLDLLFVHNRYSLSGRLTKFFTGSYVYHVAFVTQDRSTIYDMDLLHRSHPFKNSYHPEDILILDCPIALEEDYILREIARINGEVSKKNFFYGVFDYLAYALRPFYHFFGKSTPNFSGEICSEWVNRVLHEQGFAGASCPNCAPPSPTDVYEYITDFLFKKLILSKRDLSEYDALVGFTRKPKVTPSWR